LTSAKDIVHLDWFAPEIKELVFESDDFCTGVWFLKIEFAPLRQLQQVEVIGERL
jgi:hypothetical protein